MREMNELETKLYEALKNMMGVYDTPLSRRRFPVDSFMTEVIHEAREAIALVEQEQI